MADESAEHRDPSSSQSGHHDGWDRAANRRRLIISSLLAPPAVMTLKARSARAADSPSCAASINPSHHCT